jgi:hypothetical protein
LHLVGSPDDAAAGDAVVRTCSSCGTQDSAPADGLPEGWSLVTERKRVEYQCLSCVRSNIRSIEAKLPQEYWEF